MSAGLRLATLLLPGLLLVASGACATVDSLCLLQEAVDVKGLHLQARGVEPPPAGPPAVGEASVEQARTAARSLWLPSLLQVAVLCALTGAAFFAAAVLLGRGERKGAGYYASGCCGGTLLVLASGIFAAKVTLSRLAGPAPVGPTLVAEPIHTSMQVEIFIPFAAALINTPGPIHELYKEGMQRAIETAKHTHRHSQGAVDNQAGFVVKDVQARLADGAPNWPMGHCRDDPWNWQSSGNHSCKDYAARSWCAADGSHGPAWAPDWGTFQDAASTESLSAAAACCDCGGGDRLTKWMTPQSSKVVLNFTLVSTGLENNATEMRTPDVHIGTINEYVKKAANVTKENVKSPSGYVPRWARNLAHGKVSAMSVDDPSVPPPGSGAEGIVYVPRQKGDPTGTFTSHVSADPRIRCTAQHSLSRDMQEAGRVAVKERMSAVAKFLEGAAAEASWLKLMLADRCNDASQAEPMRVCISDHTAWADFVSIEPVTLPRKQKSIEEYLCKVSCDIQKSLYQHKQDAIREVNEKVSSLAGALHASTIQLSCSLAQVQCPPCA